MDDYEELEWREKIWNDIITEVSFNHPVANECRYVSFVSKSNGRGRKKRRRPREIELLTYGNKTYVLKSHLTGDIEWIMKELYPWEMIPEHFGNDWYGAFLNVLRTMPKIKRDRNGNNTLRRK